MKAFYMERFGGPEVMKLGELPDPTPGKGEVLVEVKASSINPLDWKIRSGGLALVTGRKFPKVVGSDFAGVVKAVGPGVTGFKPGDRVYGGAMIFLGKPGSHAERVCLSEKKVRAIPAGMSFEQAASLPVAALTALNGLRQCGELSGKTVLVNGATGGVGHFAVQIAKAKGAKVTAVCSARNTELARSLGADEVIDYAKTDVTAAGRQWDVFFDAAAQAGIAKGLNAVSPKGAYANTLPRPAAMIQSVLRKVIGGKQVVMANMRDKPEDYVELERLVSSGAVKPVIEQRFSLEKLPEAFAVCEGGKVRGKCVITHGGSGG